MYDQESEYMSSCTWPRVIMAMSLLPAFAVSLAGNVLKDHSPSNGMRAFDQRRLGSITTLTHPCKAIMIILAQGLRIRP